MAKRFWLLKTEPETFSFEDLVKAPKRTTHWEGVRNYQARNFMRDDFKVGDRAFIYHSNVDEPGIFGVAEIVREGYPDMTAFDSKSKYYDAAAKKKGINPWVLIDVKATHRLKNPVTREKLFADKRLKSMVVLQKGSRLSVQPVKADEFDVILELGSPESV